MIDQNIALIHAPFSGGAGMTGCELAPAALRMAGLESVLRGAGHTVRNDWVDLQDCASGGRATLLQMQLACQRVRSAVGGALTNNELPILVGGDHSLSIGSLAAVSRHCRARRRPLWVLWLDAHADFNTFATSPSGNVHGMPAAVACGLGEQGLLALGDRVPMVEPSRFYLIGVRSIDEAEQAVVRSCPVHLYTMADARHHSLAALIEGVLHLVEASGGHLHVSIDIDVLDPVVAPGVGSPEADGVGLEAMQEGLQRIAASGLLGSLDVMELNPSEDVDGVTVRLTTSLIDCVLGRNDVRRSTRGSPSGIPSGIPRGIQSAAS